MGFGGQYGGIAGSGVGQGLAAAGQNIADGLERNRQAARQQKLDDFSIAQSKFDAALTISNQAEKELKDLEAQLSDPSNAGIMGDLAVKYNAARTRWEHARVQLSSAYSVLDPQYAKQSGADGKPLDIFGLAGMSSGKDFGDRLAQRGKAASAVAQDSKDLAELNRQIEALAKLGTNGNTQLDELLKKRAEVEARLESNYPLVFGDMVKYTRTSSDPKDIERLGWMRAQSDLVTAQLSTLAQGGDEEALALLQKYQGQTIPMTETFKGKTLLAGVRSTLKVQNVENLLETNPASAALAIFAMDAEELKNQPDRVKHFRNVLLDPEKYKDDPYYVVASKVTADLKMSPVQLANALTQGQYTANLNTQLVLEIENTKNMRPAERSAAAFKAANDGDTGTLNSLVPLLKQDWMAANPGKSDEDFQEYFASTYLKDLERGKSNRIVDYAIKVGQATSLDLSNDKTFGEMIESGLLYTLNEAGQAETIRKRYIDLYGPDVGLAKFNQAITNSKVGFDSRTEAQRNQLRIQSEQIIALTDENAFNKELRKLLLDEKNIDVNRKRDEFREWVNLKKFRTLETAAQALGAAASVFGEEYLNSPEAAALAKQFGISLEGLKTKTRFEAAMRSDELTKNNYTELMTYLRDPELAMGAAPRVRALAGKLGMNPDRVMNIVSIQSSRTARYSDAQLSDLLTSTWARTKGVEFEGRRVDLASEQFKRGIYEFDVSRADRNRQFNSQLELDQARLAWQVVNDVRNGKLNERQVNTQQLQALAGERSTLTALLSEARQRTQYFEAQGEKLLEDRGTNLYKVFSKGGIVVKGGRVVLSAKYANNPELVNDGLIQQYLTAMNNAQASRREQEQHSQDLQTLRTTLNDLGRGDESPHGGGVGGFSAGNLANLADIDKVLGNLSGPSGDIVRTAYKALTDPRFTGEQYYCTRFARQVVENALNLPDRALSGVLFGANPIETRQLWANKGMLLNGGQPVDLAKLKGQLPEGAVIFQIFDNKPDSIRNHTALIGKNGEIVQNSTYSDNKTQGYKGRMSLDEFIKSSKGAQVYIGVLDPTKLKVGGKTGPKAAPTATNKPTAPAAAPKPKGEFVFKPPSIPSGQFKVMTTASNKGYLSIPEGEGRYKTFTQGAAERNWVTQLYVQAIRHDPKLAKRSLQDRQDIMIGLMQEWGYGGDIAAAVRRVVK